MRIAILANNRTGFIKPMAEGLKQMLDSLGVTTDIFPDGLLLLDYSHEKKIKTGLKNTIKYCTNLLTPKYFNCDKNISWSEVKRFETQIKTYDLIIVVCNIPDAFLVNKLSRIEKIRTQTDIPITLYQSYYLATRGPWSRNILDAILYRGGFGLERYDWYLSASVVSEYPLSHEVHPYSVIGHDLRGARLPIDLNKPFKVLLDFKRKGFENFRQLQIQALEETETEYTQLSGHYSRNNIQKLYQQHSALFLSFRESFGLPIVENQLYGNYIFAPHKNWVSSHYINKSVHEIGEGELGDNFIIYNNDLIELKRLIRQCRKNYQPKKNIENFKSLYPALYHGDLTELKVFLDKVASGKILGDTHRQHARLNKNIVSHID
jgi:hypothetical protein